MFYFFYFIGNQVELRSAMGQYPNNILEYPHLRNGIFDKLIRRINFLRKFHRFTKCTQSSVPAREGIEL